MCNRAHIAQVLTDVYILNASQLTGAYEDMIRWRVAALLRQRGWTAYRLAKEADLSFRTAYRVAQDGAVPRIDAATLEALCDLFGAVPGDLIERVGPLKRSRRGKR